MSSELAKQLEIAGREYVMRFNRPIPETIAWESGRRMLELIQQALKDNVPLPEPSYSPDGPQSQP